MWNRTPIVAAAKHSATIANEVGVVEFRHMVAKETTLGEIGEMLERGFKAVADDIADIRRDLATKEDVRAIVREELEPVEARLTSIESELRSIRRDLDELREKVAH